MNLFQTCALLSATFVITAGAARPPEPVRTATIKMASRSVRLGEATADATSLTFSTLGAGARLFGNGELRPSATREGVHESAYAAFEGDTRVESGTLYVTLPSTDANANAIPDVLDPDAAVDATVSGEMLAKGAATADQVTLRLQRNAGSDTGIYTLTGQGPALSGTYSILHGEGTVEYQRTDNGSILHLDLSHAVTNTTAVSRVLDSNTVRIAAFRLRVSPTRTVRVGPTTLERLGQIYQGDALISDGLTETAAPDYRWFLLQLADSNDRNANGVPDFSDALPPYIAVQPSRKIAAPGSDVVLSVVVEGTGPFTYEWQQNGHELSNAGANPNNRILVLPNATLEDKGSYRVRVSNAAGTVWSDSTSVSFLGQ